MKILSTNNQPYSMNDIPDEVEDVQFCILDYSDKDNVDYQFIPLLFMETFHSPCAELQIGKHIVTMPIDWSIIIADKNSGAIEPLELTKLNDRPFNVFCLNPINGFYPEFLEIKIKNIHPEFKWFFPKLKNGHIIAIPLEDKESPLCAFFVHDVNKLPDELDIGQLV